VVTAQNGTTRTYSITVTRAPSNNALLSILKLTPSSALVNTGAVGGTTTYTTSVSNATASVTITPTTQDATATIKVNAVNVTSGTASGSIALPVGQTIINTVVTAQDGTTTHTYSVTVTRAPSSDALLSIIKLTPASVLTNTGTTGNATTYTTPVSNATTSVTVTPTAHDATATIKVNGTAVTSGTASGIIILAVGSNTITTIVTAQDGTTTHTYSITVTRAAGPLLSLHQPIQPVSVVKPTDSVAIENDGVMVHQAVSPNGDGINDYLHIDGLAAYPDNNLMIIDRNGTIIFEAAGYDNNTKVFDGHSSINGRMQQPGTYFYSLDYVVNGQSKHKTGFILLKY
jgi:gliding motility-associated-like protein